MSKADKQGGDGRAVPMKELLKLTPGKYQIEVTPLGVIIHGNEPPPEDEEPDEDEGGGG